MQVATQRAKAVERLLIGKGIAAARISPPVAKGRTDSFTSDAKTPQDEEANRRGNRRVVVTFSHPAAP
jgi:outer membrane protein OmpA-like peptidoglycan-associated protein